MAVLSLQKWVSLTPNTMVALHVSAVGPFSGELNNLSNTQALSANEVEIVSSPLKIEDNARSVAMRDA